MQAFRKTNDSRYRDSLLKEADGLEQLRKTVNPSRIKIPDVFSVNDHVMEMTAIQSESCSSQQMQQLGQGLAELHQEPMQHYGYVQDNYIGLNPQKNAIADTWGRFYLEYRLKPQMAWIKDKHTSSQFAGLIQQYETRLVEFLDAWCEQPSLVHGDLWSGNYMCDKHDVWLIDPAVYYADREVDLAMTEMFGGFSQDFYQAYDAVYPRTKVYESKRSIYNLYHYLNHYNLFGSSYLSGCEAGLEAIERL